MKRLISILSMLCLLVYVAAAFGCGGSTVAPKTEPEPAPIPEPTPEPSIENLRKPVAKDPDIFKAIVVIEKVSKITKKAISYEKYLTLAGGQEGGAFDPDWFYDSHNLEMNEDGYWATVILGSAQKAKERDPRIGKLMADLPAQSITIKLKTPTKRVYILLDQEADGILDFAKPAESSGSAKIDIQLLDHMQEKYTWLLSLIKKHYKK